MTKIKWVTLENESGTGTMKQHGFIEIYDGNKMLCSRGYMDDGNGSGTRMPWVRIKSETLHPQACRNCIKLSKRKPN
jgi:hypothetical protein